MVISLRPMLTRQLCAYNVIKYAALECHRTETIAQLLESSLVCSAPGSMRLTAG